MSETSWRDTDFDRPAESTPPSGLANRTLLRVLSGAALALSLFAYGFSRDRAVFRCRQECLGAPPMERYGSLTYEPGHPWTHYAGSWQWSVQHGLTQLAVVAALAALGLAATSRRNPLPALAVVAGALTAWIAWVVLSPPIP